MLPTRLVTLVLVAVVACSLGCAEPVADPAPNSGAVPAAAEPAAPAETQTASASLPELRYYVIGPQ